jgi:hypothetical protein
VSAVRAAITDRLWSEGARMLVCSAACGADLLALDAAQQLHIRRRIVLPFSAGRFRASSVVDRPNPEFWGKLFDRMITTAREQGDLVELNGAEHNEAAYSAANHAIIDEARAFADAARQDNPKISTIAILIWDGAPRGGADATSEFADLARAAGFEVREVRTLSR